MARQKALGDAITARLTQGEASLSDLYAAASAARGADVPQSSVRQWCNVATNEGRIERIGRGRYRLAGSQR